jgi:hypothetical protein
LTIQYKAYLYAIVKGKNMKFFKLSRAVLCFCAAAVVTPAFGWGEKGHNAIARVAEAHLTRKAEREVRKLLGGHNMAYWSSWADGLRDDARYDHMSSWHYANAEEGRTYASSVKNPAGDVVTAVELCIEELGAANRSDSLRSHYLKLLIHFVGDMHCPMHAGHASDRGGNGHPVDFRGTRSNLHRLWDSQLIDAAHVWSALEWAVNMDYRMGRRQRAALQAGGPRSWMEETMALSHAIYAGTERDATISWDYINRYSPVAERRLLEAGYRLARLLNELFG